MKSGLSCQTRFRLEIFSVLLKPFSSHVSLNPISKLYRVNIDRYSCLRLPIPFIVNKVFHEVKKAFFVYKSIAKEVRITSN